MDWPAMVKYACDVKAQKHWTEIITDLTSMIRELLRSFQSENCEKLPQKIIFYRDGVSESQFNEVREHEIKKIKEACRYFGGIYKPSVTFVVVQKRHHTRLFPLDYSGNIKPDHTITRPDVFNFYLCSHGTAEGTSRPALYHVLQDDNGFDPYQLQSLTNDLCYTFAKCTSSTSIVPPVQYAHLAASRARLYMVGETSGPGAVMKLPPVHGNIKRKMFFC